MKKISLLFGLALLAGLVPAGSLSGQSPIAPGVSGGPKAPGEFKGYAGSASCIDCHEKFYQLWSTSLRRRVTTTGSSGSGLQRRWRASPGRQSGRGTARVWTGPCRSTSTRS